MIKEIEELLLGKEYGFHVTIKHGMESYAGEMVLHPDTITLKVTGERTEGEDFALGWTNHDTLFCKDLRAGFLLVDLRLKSAHGKVLEHKNHRIHFEMSYEVKYVVFFPKPSPRLSLTSNFWRFEVFSNKISNWIGHTKKQEEILAHHFQRKNLSDPDFLFEFKVNLDGGGMFGARYHPKIFVSAPEFKAGIVFPPSIFFEPSSNVSVFALITHLNEVLNLAELVTGGELATDKVLLHGDCGSGAIYFSREGVKNNAADRVLFPLGHELETDFGFPALPHTAFYTYFALEPHRRLFFAQYIRYRRRDNTEERFLGYFRLLEALTLEKGSYLDGGKLEQLCSIAKPFLVKKFGDKKSVEAFIRRLPRLNSSKYNTEKCLKVFFNTIPAGVTEKWKFDQKTLEIICKLRNDLSHANPIALSDSDLRAYTVFTEALLVLALFRELSIPLDTSSRHIFRMRNYNWILKQD